MENTFTQTDIKTHIEKIRYILDNLIPENEITILVGDNGTGKSLIRKLMPFTIQKRHSKKSAENLVLSMSMQTRTESRAEYGALSSLAHDTPERPTSTCTYNLFNHLLEDIKNSKNKRFLIIDEPEIGMSKESQLAFAQYLKSLTSFFKKKTLGVLIITHSEIFVETFLKKSHFVNLSYNKIDTDPYKWLNREIKPTDFEFLENWSTDLFKEIRNQTK